MKHVGPERALVFSYQVTPGFCWGIFCCFCASTSIRHDTVEVGEMCAYNREEDDDEENRVGKKRIRALLTFFGYPATPNVAIQDYYHGDSSHRRETGRDVALHRPATRQDCRVSLPISTTFYFVNAPLFTNDTLQLYAVML